MKTDSILFIPCKIRKKVVLLCSTQQRNSKKGEYLMACNWEG